MQKHTWKTTVGAMVVLGVMLCSVPIIGIFVAGGGIFAVFAVTQPAVDASEQFLTLVGQERTKEAYASTAEAFRARQDEAAFTAAVKTLELTDFASATWTNRRIDNDKGTVEGTVTTRKNATTPIAITLVREQGQWKVAELRYGGVELTQVKPVPPPVPEIAALRKLTLDTLLDFNQAVKAADFTAFYPTISTAWKKDTDPVRLLKGFQVFVDNKLDITGVKDVQPEFRPDALINAKGLLEISGHYPTRPVRVNFTLRYQHELGGWKIYFMDISVNQ